MRVLIVEDDENKRNQLVAFFSLQSQIKQVDTSKSLRSGIDSIIDTKYDLIITDMTMPTFDITIDEDGGRIQAYAGREILRYMDRRGINVPVVVVTQFDRFGEGSEALALEELDELLKIEHADVYCGAVYYDTSSESWKEKLEKKISNIERN